MRKQRLVAGPDPHPLNASLKEAAAPDDPAVDDAAEERRAVSRLRSGDPGAARWLIETFQGVVLGVCLRMLGHRHDAEDVAQEVFLRALRAMPGFDPERPLRPWLVGIAANRCRTALARRARRPVSIEPPLDRPDPRPSQADPDDLAGELERALRLLRPEYRQVFSLYHEHGLDYDAIAKAVGRPVGTVKTWLHRARGQLARELAQRGVDCPSTPASEE